MLYSKKVNIIFNVFANINQKENNIPKSTVQDIITLFDQQGHVDAKKSTGRPQEITIEQQEMMIEQIKQNCEVTAEDICRNNEINPNGLSAQTFRNALNKEGIIARRMQNTHCISEQNREDRLNWALEHQDWSVKDFR
ncbi:hypothetical protein ABPG72_002998 [Tetrahymena utriculariae]